LRYRIHGAAWSACRSYWRALTCAITGTDDTRARPVRDVRGKVDIHNVSPVAVLRFEVSNSQSG
ncbi:hypothetical protein NL529_27870, partial [Klebsiella pneumoniae]|nr:hypothetical protein [Klebsiella pneumoniae]